MRCAREIQPSVQEGHGFSAEMRQGEVTAAIQARMYLKRSTVRTIMLQANA